MLIRFVVTLSVVLALSVAGYAQEFAVPIRATLNVGSTKTFIYTFGADRAATDSLDRELGEKEIPTLRPPGDIFYVWTVPPTEELIWLSPLDLRPYTIDAPSVIEYRVQVNWFGGVLTFSYGSTPLPSQIDSMYIVDGYTEFPDNVLKMKVEPGASIQTNNPAFEEFKVLIWCNGTTTSVAEERSAQPLSLYPNPTSDAIMIRGDKVVGSEVQIVSCTGEILDRSKISVSEPMIPVSHLAPGWYGARVLTSEGVTILPFVRQ